MKRCCITIASLLATATLAVAQDRRLPTLHTNESFIEEATRTTTLAVNDPMAVFAFVLNGLPERVKVYPTENYYYFSFIHDSRRYAGNIRLDASNRDAGKVDFAYFEELPDWDNSNAVTHVLLDSSHGVRVEKIEPLVYRITYKQRSVVFALNDLSRVKPPAKAMGPNEKFIGPIFDESGIRFFLIYNPKLKVFHYLLDETVRVADSFVRSAYTDRILIGRRSAFAFYRDHRRDRKILIGVYDRHIRANNYFDGPFDQLPDNFLEGETLRDIIIDLEPSLKGHIDRFGGSFDGTVRYLIGPYLPYAKPDDLKIFHACALRRVRLANYYQCFDGDRIEKERPPRPPRLKQLRKSEQR